MCSATGRVKLVFAIVICVFNHSCQAQVQYNTSQDCASSCGNIHNIQYPFRLYTDPAHCGTNDYELSCENDVLTLLMFRVEAINYNNLTIRLWDPNLELNNCGLPVGNPEEYNGLSSSYYNYSELSYISYETTAWDLVFISCEYPMSGSVFEEYISPCNFTRHWYIKVVDYDEGREVMPQMGNSCRVEAQAITYLQPNTTKNISYVDFNNSFADGFELSWDKACCATSEVSRIYDCPNYGCVFHLTIVEQISK